LSGERILVVDDGRENRDFVVDYILRPNGYRALVARDGREGLEKAIAERPDLMLLDLQMPRMNGIEVLQAMHQENLNIPVILMTFHGSEEIAIEVFRLGVRDYVKKPYTIEEMLDAIERNLTETRLRREKEALTERLLLSNRELQRRIKELNVLYKMGKTVTSILDTDHLAVRVVEAATYVTGAQEGNLLLVEDGKLICRAAKRFADSHARAMRIESQDRLAERVMQTGQAVVLTPEELARARTENPNVPLAVLYTPLVMGERLLGVLGVDNVADGGRPFTEHDGALLSALADYAAIALENARNVSQLVESKEREKQHIRQAFERYVAPSVVGRALERTDAMALGGMRQEISILFADLRGYTTYSEQADPEHVVEMLNQYFRIAADVILAREGTLDKFLGDAVMAIFNAPQPQPDHPYRAVEAALTLRQAVEEWNTQHGSGLLFGIGVNIGEAVVGNVGAALAMNYTAIGDAVNLAKRLQERAAPGQILITDSVAKRLGSQIRTTPLGAVQVKGRQQPVVVYELLGLA
jgi:class 3 adenylate cyclase/DNA-binding response OmpR family regulator